MTFSSHLDLNETISRVSTSLEAVEKDKLI